jgi:hypothetical protein
MVTPPGLQGCNKHKQYSARRICNPVRKCSVDVGYITTLTMALYHNYKKTKGYQYVTSVYSFCLTLEAFQENESHSI